jgi:Rieske Fe-S protein
MVYTLAHRRLRNRHEPAQPASPPAASVLGPSTAVPVGGGIVYAKRQVVVTQPTEGDFRAFSAICTHARCMVSAVTDGTIYCPCHGSTFSITNGAALKGPATKALPAVKVSEDDGNLRLV